MLPEEPFKLESRSTCRTAQRSREARIAWIRSAALGIPSSSSLNDLVSKRNNTMSSLATTVAVRGRWSTNAISPIDPYHPLSVMAQFETQQALARISPVTLYGEIATMLLDPASRTVGPVFMSQLQGALVGAPLPTLQSILIIWPQISGLFAAMVILFTGAYVVFQRQEGRA